MKIRDAGLEDLPVILAITNDAILHSTAIYDYHARSIDDMTAWFEKKMADKMPVIVCEQNGEAVGFGSYGIFRPRDGYKFSAEHSIYIQETSRGQGLGRHLLQSLIERAKAQNFHTMIAGIDAENTDSIAFHQKFGFIEVAKFKEVGFKFGKWLDLVFMQLLLNK